MSEHRKTRGRWINGAQSSCVDEGQPEGMVYCSVLLLRFHYHVAVNLVHHSFSDTVLEFLHLLLWNKTFCCSSLHKEFCCTSFHFLAPIMERQSSTISMSDSKDLFSLQCIFASLVISNIDKKTSSLSPNRSYSSKNSIALPLFGQ